MNEFGGDLAVWAVKEESIVYAFKEFSSRNLVGRLFNIEAYCKEPRAARK